MNDYKHEYGGYNLLFGRWLQIALQNVFKKLRKPGRLQKSWLYVLQFIT